MSTSQGLHLTSDSPNPVRYQNAADPCAVVYLPIFSDAYVAVRPGERVATTA